MGIFQLSNSYFSSGLHHLSVNSVLWTAASKHGANFCGMLAPTKLLHRCVPSRSLQVPQPFVSCKVAWEFTARMTASAWKLFPLDKCKGSGEWWRNSMGEEDETRCFGFWFARDLIPWVFFFSTSGSASLALDNYLFSPRHSNSN